MGQRIFGERVALSLVVVFAAECFSSIEGTRSVLLGVGRVMSSQERWQVRFPRKRPVQSVGTFAGQAAKRLCRRSANDVLQSDRRPACAPAACRLSSLCADSNRFAAQVAPPSENVSKLAR